MASTALITGASSGIGRELALAFASHGHDLVIVARRKDLLDELAQRCREQHGANVECIPMDLLEPDAPLSLYEQAPPDIEILVNNAGVAESGAFAEIPLETHERLVQLNVAVLTTLTRLFVGPMVSRRRGRVLNVASVAAFQPIPALASYAASKAFVLSLSEALHEELRGTGVSVTALCPGITRTELVDRVQEQNTAAGMLPGFLIGDARSVANEGYVACMQGRPVVAPGLPNLLGTTLVRMYPRWLVRRIGGLIGRRAL
jgi:short-subunit dehydrogenase